MLIAAALATQSQATAAQTAVFTSYASVKQTTPGYTPDQVAAAYNLSPVFASGIDGSGQTIALVEYGSFLQSDISQFDSANSLTAANIQEFYTGNAVRHATDPETTMDIEWAHAMAPGAAIQVYYLSTQNANAAGWASIAKAVTMAQNNGARVISMSFGVCGPSRGYTVLQSALATAFKHGVTTFVSSGDDGALAGPVRQCGNVPGVGYPASDPSVVAVGGTSVRLAVDNSLAMETAWSLSGGGNGKPFLRPSWQVTSTLGHGRYRYAPDVAFIANPSTGAAIIYRGRWAAAGGTSLGAPAWAGIWALVEADAAQNGKTPSAAPPLLYRIGNSAAYTQAFNDVTSGANGRYTAHSGWDAVTGWGTPNVQGLITAVEAIS